MRIRKRQSVSRYRRLLSCKSCSIKHVSYRRRVGAFRHQQANTLKSAPPRGNMDQRRLHLDHDHIEVECRGVWFGPYMIFTRMNYANTTVLDACVCAEREKYASTESVSIERECMCCKRECMYRNGMTSAEAQTPLRLNSESVKQTKTEVSKLHK